jgi:hypothetical protein
MSKIKVVLVVGAVGAAAAGYVFRKKIGDATNQLVNILDAKLDELEEQKTTRFYDAALRAGFVPGGDKEPANS